MDKKNTGSNINNQDRSNTPSRLKAIVVAALLTLFGGKLEGQQLNQMSPDMQKKWTEMISKAPREDHFECKVEDGHIHQSQDDVNNGNNHLQTRNGILYNDCDTIRSHDLYIDVAPRSDNFKYETTIDSVYREEGINRKNTGITMMPFTDEIAAWLTDRYDIKNILADIKLYIISGDGHRLPQTLIDSIDMIYHKYSPDIINFTVPRGMGGAGGITFGPSYKDHTFGINNKNITVVKNVGDFENKPTSGLLYSKLKKHEEGHIQGKSHPNQENHYNEDNVEVPGWVPDPNRSGYMRSSLSGGTTRDDVQINKDMAKEASKVLLRVNEARECQSLSINHPDKTEVDIITYPNPTSSSIVVQDENNMIEWSKISLINMVGNKLDIKKQDNNSISLDHLPAGIYYLQLPLKTGKIRVANIIKM